MWGEKGRRRDRVGHVVGRLIEGAGRERRDWRGTNEGERGV